MAPPAKTPFDDARAALYAATPTDFVARRKELAAGLKAAGDPGGARLLGALPKPSAHAWAVNHLHRTGSLAKVMAVGHAHRLAQARMSRGQLDAKAARAAQDAHRAAVTEAAREGRAALAGAGLGGTDAIEGKIATLLQAVSLRGSFAPYAEGCLAGDVEPPSLDEMLDGLVEAPPAVAIPAATEPAAAPAPDPAVAAARAEEARRREIEAEAQRKRDAARAAQKAVVEQREARARDARDARDVAKHRADRARVAVTEAEAALSRAKDALAQTEAHLRATTTEVADAERELVTAQEALAAL